MKRQLILSIIVIGLLSMTVSCGQQKKSGDAAASKEKTKVVIFVGFGTGTNPDQITQQEELQEVYNSSHDDIEIEFLIVPHDEANDRYLAMLSGGDAPQLVGPNGIAGLAQQYGNWSDISQFIAAEKYDMSDFYSESVNLFKTTGNELLGLPIGLFPSMIFYNKDLFDAAGVKYPTHDYGDKSWNYDQLRKIAIEVTRDKNSNNPLSPKFDPNNIRNWGYDDSWISARGYLSKWGSEFVGRPTTPDYKAATANNKEWVYGLQWLSDGIWKDRFIPDATGQSTYYGAGADPFGGGMVAMFESHTWFFAEGLGSLSFDHDIAPIPYNQKGERVARIHANIFAIPEAAKNKEAAWEVMKWLTSPDQAVELALIYGCIPARKSLSDEYQKVLEEKYPGLDYSVMYNAVQYLDDPHHESWVPGWSKVEEILGNALSLVYTGEEKDAKKVLDQANKEIQVILDNN